MSGRWVKICQDCFQELHPHEYCPDLTDVDECSVCGNLGLVANVHPDMANKPIEQKGDMNMDEW